MRPTFIQKVSWNFILHFLAYKTAHVRKNNFDLKIFGSFFGHNKIRLKFLYLYNINLQIFLHIRIGHDEENKIHIFFKKIFNKLDVIRNSITF